MDGIGTEREELSTITLRYAQREFCTLYTHLQEKIKTKKRANYFENKRKSENIQN